jgi:hypothetical protein
MVDLQVWTIVLSTTLPSIFIAFILLSFGIIITRRTYRAWNFFRFPSYSIPLKKKNLTKYHYKKMIENIENNTSKEALIPYFYF